MKQLSEQQKHNLCKSALLLKRDIEVSFLQLGELLYKIKNETLFEAGWESWEEYEMEFRMPSSTISRLIRIYEVFRLRYSFPQAELAEIGWSGLAEILPILPPEASKSRAEELMGQVAVQSRSDLRRTIKEAKTGISMSKCKHPNAYVIKVCPDCGDREKIYQE